MAALRYTSITLPQPDRTSGYRKDCRKTSVNFSHGRTVRTTSISIAAATATDASSTAPEKPVIELDFIGPKPGAVGSYPVDKAAAISGDKLLRNIMLDNKIELYAAYGKVMNCGGGGSCGTCIVEIVDGKELLNERTNTELKYLKKKPESWRLACQTIVGDKENSGKVASVEEVIRSLKLEFLTVKEDHSELMMAGSDPD